MNIPLVFARSTPKAIYVPPSSDTSGTTDAAAIQAAIDAIKSSGGKVLLDGAYYTNTRVGTNPATSNDWAHHTSLIGEPGTTLNFTSSASGACICLEGNDVKVQGIQIQGYRTINYDQDLTAQRVVFQNGIVVGGKNYLQSPRSSGSLTDFVSGAAVLDCKVFDFNAPITVFRASDAKVKRNTVQRFTDTGILIDDCTANVTVDEQNTVEYGGDDCIYVRHYNNSPWVTAGRSIRGLWIDNNTLRYTFGKCIGFSSFADIFIRGNETEFSYAGNIAWARGTGDFAQGSLEYMQRVLIEGNTIRYGGRLWGSSQPVVAHRTALGQHGDGGIQSVSENSRTGTYYRRAILRGNIVDCPNGDGISIAGIDHCTVEGNLIVCGAYDHGAGAVYSSGAGIYIAAAENVVVRSNTITGDGQNFAYCYNLSSTNGGAHFANIKLHYNSEAFLTGCRTGDVTALAAVEYIGAN